MPPSPAISGSTSSTRSPTGWSRRPPTGPPPRCGSPGTGRAPRRRSTPGSWPPSPARTSAISWPSIEQLDRHHPAGTFHHHLAILAVRPDRQGQGIGTALLHAHHAVLEDQGIPAYLEASDERTRRLYLAHGYTDRGSPIELADGVRMYPMWREPRTGDRAG